MPANSVRLGPGTFSLGTVPAAYDCQVQSMGVNVDKSTSDDIPVLCGDVILGTATYAYSLAGTVLQDFAADAGLVQYSWEHMGETVDFVFTPNTAAGTSCSGQLVMDPLSFGDSGAAYGDILTSDFEWAIQGLPEFAWPIPGGAAAATTTSKSTAESVPA
jgi:hypothetical protein